MSMWDYIYKCEIGYISGILIDCGDHYEVNLNMTGFKKEEIELTLTSNGLLLVDAKNDACNSFRKCYVIPTCAKTELIKAKMIGEVLTILLNKKHMDRKIEIA